MLQVYRRQTRIKPFAPILKDKSFKRWDSEVSLPTNISLLSISNSSNASDDEDKVEGEQNSNENDSSSSRESISIVQESKDLKDAHIPLDVYILNKHLHGIPSTSSKLSAHDIDQAAYELFDESRSSYDIENDEYNPRAIRPPSFTHHIKQVQESRTKTKPVQRRSARIPVRTTKAERLKLARQQSDSFNMPNLPHIRSSTMKSQPTFTSKSQMQSSTIFSANTYLRSRTTSSTTLKQSESALSCKSALGTKDPLRLSSMLVRQMRQDIQTNKVPSYSKPLNSALLREQPHPPLSNQYKLKRVRNWLKTVNPTDCIEYNENASIRTIPGTNLNDKIDFDSDILSEEKQHSSIERSSEEAHRLLPLFQTAIQRQLQQRDLILTRIELDLYVI